MGNFGEPIGLRAKHRRVAVFVLWQKHGASTFAQVLVSFQWLERGILSFVPGFAASKIRPEIRPPGEIHKKAICLR